MKTTDTSCRNQDDGVQKIKSIPATDLQIYARKGCITALKLSIGFLKSIYNIDSKGFIPVVFFDSPLVCQLDYNHEFVQPRVGSIQCYNSAFAYDSNL